jgi:hypothetical protein
MCSKNNSKRGRVGEDQGLEAHSIEEWRFIGELGDGSHISGECAWIC